MLQPGTQSGNQILVLRFLLKTNPLRLPTQPRLRSRSLLCVQQTGTDINEIGPAVGMPEHRGAAFAAEFAIDPFGAIIPFQGAGAEVETFAAGLPDVGLGYESPGLDVEAGCEAAFITGTRAAQVFRAVFGKPPNRIVSRTVLFRCRRSDNVTPRRS